MTRFFFLLVASASLTGCIVESDDPEPEGPVECQVGDSRPSADGCNTCECTDEGWACTLIACPEECPAGEARNAEGECVTLCFSDQDCEAGGTCNAEDVCLGGAGPEGAGLAVCGGWCSPGAECTCPAVYAPVCGPDGHTHGNECEADCANAEIDYAGECAPVECACDLLYAPVCGVDGQTYGNACEAGCARVQVSYEGECANRCMGAGSCGAEAYCTSNDLCLDGGQRAGGAAPGPDGDSDEPRAGAAPACFGHCVPDSCPDPDAPGVDYYGTPDECQLIDFGCGEDQVGFSSDCGCGCQPG